MRFALSALCAAAEITARHVRRSPRASALVCGTAAAVIGIGYVRVAGAPGRYIILNGAALAMALVIAARLAGGRALPIRPDMIVLAGSIALLATAVFGASVEGAARWTAIGGVAVQPSLILLPAMIVAASAMALQPDRSMAAELVAGAGAPRTVQPQTARGPALAALCAWIVTMIRPDTLRARPFVDGIPYSSFSLQPLVGLGLLGGVMLLPLPALLLRRDRTPELTMFGVTWVAVVFAAALGTYPTPLIGCLLSACCLPRPPPATPRTVAPRARSRRPLRIARSPWIHRRNDLTQQTIAV